MFSHHKSVRHKNSYSVILKTTSLSEKQSASQSHPSDTSNTWSLQWKPVDFLWTGIAAAELLPLVNLPCFLSTFCFLFAYLFMSSLLSSSEAGRKRSWAPTFGLPKHSPPRLNKAYNEKRVEKKKEEKSIWDRLHLEPLWWEGLSAAAAEGQNLSFFFLCLC